MSSREEILAAVRRHLPQAAEHPSLDQEWTTYDDPHSQFAEVLHGVGGACVRVPNLAAVQAHMQTVELYREAREICHAVPGLPGGNVDLEAVEDSHDLETVDYALLPGEFAVAENGAVWTSMRGISHRAIYFIAQHVSLVVPASEVVHNMHEAYRRLSFEGPGYGVFISGPSKTADIEQSLVIGAHGARSQIVFLVDDLPAGWGDLLPR